MKVLSELSKEELLKIIEDQRVQISTLLEEKRELNIKLNELIRKYEIKVAQYNKQAYEIFCPKSEIIKDEEKVINEAETKVKRKSPSQTFIEELKPLAAKTIIKDYDFIKNGVDRNKVRPFGEDVSYKIEYIAHKFEVVKIKRPKYRDKDKIYQALSTDPYPNSPLSPSLAANIIEMKYSLGIPLYRYSNYLKTLGINISDQNLSNYVLRSADS